MWLVYATASIFLHIIKTLKKLLLYPWSALFYVLFGLTLVIFQALQWLSLKLGGYQAHKVSVDFLNLGLMACLYVMGNRCSYTNRYKLPANKPLIIVSNHQSMFDIIVISWFMRKYHPKFISKIELGKGLPSISFNLNYGGSVLIDRKNPRQSIPALTKFGKYIAQNNRTAVIFPEGTRSRNGVPKTFSTTGLKILLKNIPDAILVPVTVNNSWKLLRYGAFPVNAAVHLSLEVQEPIPASALPEDELLNEVESRVKKNIRIKK